MSTTKTFIEEEECFAAYIRLIDLVSHLKPEWSRSHCRRLIQQKGVTVYWKDGAYAKPTDPNAEVFLWTTKT